MQNIVFIDNIAFDTGGAVECGEGAPKVLGCVFINNSAGLGGAVNASGPAVISDCVFSGNSADDPIYGGSGGGLSLSGFPAAYVANCIIHDCLAGTMGGAVHIDIGCSATLLNCTFSGNESPDGSGIGLENSSALTLVNTVIAFGCTGAAVSGSGTVDAFCCNVFGNGGGDWTGLLAGQSGINGNISGDPLFVDRLTGDLHLRYDSPCRDSGDDQAPGLSEEDFEGDPRIAIGTVDMGADEFHDHLYYFGDASPGGSIEVKLVGMPGASPVGLFIGSGILDPPLPTEWGDFYLQSPWILLVLWPVSSTGVLILPATLPAVPPAPYDIFLQALIGAQLSNVSILSVDP